MRQALIRDKRYAGLCLLPAAQTRDKDAVNPEQMREVCKELSAEFDYVIIDCPAGIEQGFKNAIAGADRAIIVATPEVSSIRDADRIIGLLESEGKVDIKLIVNRVRSNMVKKGDMMGIDDMIDILGIELLGVIPECEHIIVSTNRGEPAVASSVGYASIAYRNIVRRVLGEKVAFMEMKSRGGFMERFKGLFSF